MLQKTFTIVFVLFVMIQRVYLVSSATSIFEFTKEARDALCPFVGIKGLQCFDEEPIKQSLKHSDTGTLQLPRGVGITIDRSSGRLKALATQLTYSPETGRIWTDRLTGEVFEIFNEAILGSPSSAVAAFNASRIQVFRNASQLNAAWQQTYIDGKIRGGQLANPPNLLQYINGFSCRGKTRVLSQTIIGLYMLTMKPSTVQLNGFVRSALAKLTTQFDLELYNGFVDKWGTHIITKSLIGGMIEEEAKTIRCFYGDAHSRLVQCLPFEDRLLSDGDCSYYQEHNRIISKRRLGGSVHVDKNHEWIQTLSFAPAMLQILEMVPLYDFVTDEAIKRNLRSIIQYRQTTMDMIRAEMAPLSDEPQASCHSVIPTFSVNARWEQHGTTLAGGNGLGANNNQLHNPYGLFIDHDGDRSLFISDCGNHRVMQWKRNSLWGRVVAGGNGPGSRLDQLRHPANLLIDKETNSLIISDQGNRRIIRWSRSSSVVRGEILIDNVQSFGLFMDEQRNLYISDHVKHEVRRYELDRGDKMGTLVAGGNGQGIGLHQLNAPLNLFVDKNESLYVSEYQNHRVTKWAKGATRSVVVAGGQGQGAALTQLSFPHGIFVDTSSTLYVADTWNHRVTRWPQESKQGTVVIGGNGAGTQANQVYAVVDLSFDKLGVLHVLEFASHRVQRFNLIK